MFKRPFNTVLARLGLVAAVLATLLILAPVASAADPYEVSYAENGDEPVATFSAADPDADADDIEWSLSGVDKGDFEIDGGELTFKKSPNFEKPTDRDEDTVAAGDQDKGDNVYKVTVEASGGKQQVEVTVTDEDEAGSVSFDQPQPQATRDLKATLKDDDAPLENPKWQWSRGPAEDGPWTDIQGQANRSSKPVAADIGSYLRATVTYTDKHGSQTVSGVTDNPVEARTLANAVPKFGEIDAINLNENVGGNIGDPIAATDDDNDVLLYALDGATAADNAKFKMSNSGQLSVKDASSVQKGLDYEMTGEDGRDDAAAAPDSSADPDPDAATGDEVYTVKIKAVDPSGAFGMADVTVNLKDVNESPVFDKASRDKATVYIAENTVGPGIFTSDSLGTDLASGNVGSYTATDDDGAPKDSAVAYTLEGDDAKYFIIDGTGGALTAAGDTPQDGKTSLMANFEKKGSYSVTIVATTTGGETADTDDRGSKIGKLDLTIKVVDGEDDGMVMLSAREPQEQIPVVATLDDPDGGETAIRWQWYRGGPRAADDVARAALILTLKALDHDPLTETDTENDVCTDADGGNVATATDTGHCVIDKATSALYTPGDDDIGFTLHALATYKDAITPATGLADEDAVRSTEVEVQMSAPGNTAPKFPDQDLNTFGDQSETAMRSVKENDKDARVGEPITAGDADDDKLVYRLSGPDAGSFLLGSGLEHDEVGEGQLQVKGKLDYEAQSMHTVVVTAVDPSGASDSITVTIMVTDQDDPPTITGVKKVSYAENGTDAVATFSAEDEDADAGDIEWSLSGVDKGDFEIDGGELTFKKSPNFEKPTDRDEDTVAAGDQGKGDNVYKVTVVATGDTKAEQEVGVTVTDEDEAGSVSFDQPQPQATRALTASVKDDDTPLEDSKWQWSRGPGVDGPWTDIQGQANRSRKPVAADIGSYLRATVTYTDTHGAQTASGVTDNPVETRTLANAAPKFGEIDAIPVNENVGGNIGDPIAATDDDSDVLLYALDGATAADNANFKMSKSGQLSLAAKDGLNYELTGEDGRDDAADDTTAGDAATGDEVYTVKIKAVDPSGAIGMADVTVNLKDVNESPVFDKASRDKATVYIAENTVGPGIFTNDDGLTGAVGSYTATDDDGTPKDSAVAYTLEGDDAKYFIIDGTGGALTAAGDTPQDGKISLTADKEKKGSYSVTIVATTTGGETADTDDRGSKIGKLDLTIKVVDGEDDGMVMLSAREPQEQIPVVATLDDPDGGETAIRWQWYRGGPGAANDVARAALILTLKALDHDPLTETDTENDVCTDADGGNVATATDTGHCVIDKATSALYTPGDDDIGFTLHALATYKDAITPATGPADEDAVRSTEVEVQMSAPGNTAPKFPDQDLNTFGDQSETAMRSVKENDKDARVGEPITAGDANDDKLVYRLSGPDAGSFLLGSGLEHDEVGEGQLQVKGKLDYEAQSMHTVVVTAVDPSGASDSITVTIMVTDQDDGAVISPNRAPVFGAETVELTVDENTEAGMAVGDAVMATDADGNDLTYSLGGDDAMYFSIDDMGQVTVGEGTVLDYESDKTMYMVTVTADDGTGVHNAMAVIAVTIMVTNVNDIAPMFDAEAVELSVAENTEAGMAVGDAVMATDAEGDDLAYSLGGDDAMYFAIDDMGQITVGEGTMLDYESDKTMYMVTATASDGEHDASIMVTINVGNAYAGCDTAGNMGLVNDCEALLDSKDDLGGSLNWTDDADNPITGWEGVAVSGDPMRVTSVWLRGKSLDGTIPAALNRVEMLTVLNLHSNNLNGPIPDLSGTMLVELYLAKNYDEDVAGSGLTGGVPVWLNDMTGMTHLWLWGNMLDGSIPDLNGMTSLVELKLNSNMLSGGVPMADMLPPNATWILLQKNPLGGTIPDLSSLTSLRTLWLHTNELTGLIPATLPTSVTSVNLKGNSLSGMIPDLSGLQDLQWLRLQRNQLSGEIPGTLGDLGSVTKIWLYDNQLTGIGTGFGNAADTLTDLFLTDNPFAEGTCLPDGLADVANNDFEMAGLAACAN